MRQSAHWPRLNEQRISKQDTRLRQEVIANPSIGSAISWVQTGWFAVDGCAKEGLKVFHKLAECHNRAFWGLQVRWFRVHDTEMQHIFYWNLKSPLVNDNDCIFNPIASQLVPKQVSNRHYVITGSDNTLALTDH